MTGRELINFIKENQLEDAKITFEELGSVKSFQVGKWNVKDGGEYDTLVYDIYTDTNGEIKSEIEICICDEDGMGNTRVLSSEEALALRVARE